MSAFKQYEEIGAWKMGRELVKVVYRLTSKGEFAKDWGLRDQIRRAAVSICSNIAEGFERRGNKEFIKFLWIAKGSAAEVSSQLYHAKDSLYISEDDFNACYNHAKKICAALNNLIKSISASSRGTAYIRA